MKEYFSYSLKTPEQAAHLPQIIPHPAFSYVKKQDEKLPVNIITLKNASYILLEEIPPIQYDEEPNKVVGYLSTTGESVKPKKLSKAANAILLCKGSCYELHKKTDQKIIGYIKTIEPKCYIAVTKPRNFISLLWILPILLLLILLFIPHDPPPIFGQDKVTIGAITPIEVGELDPDYFNIKINATPILENGEMNIRIENSVRNVYDCYVEVFISDKLIYTSPLLHPDESLEFATVKDKYPVGVYDGVAVFHLFDDFMELAATSSVKLMVDVRE